MTSMGMVRAKKKKKKLDPDNINGVEQSRERGGEQKKNLTVDKKGIRTLDP